MFGLSSSDLSALALSLNLAFFSSLLLLCICLPLSFYISRLSSGKRSMVDALASLPLVLPPTVVGFYLLLIFNPNKALGHFFNEYLDMQFVFSYAGLFLASCLLSFPFVFRPLLASFSQQPSHLYRAAVCLGLNARQRFLHVYLPPLLPSIISSAGLAFAHTLGEFGVILMIGGSIPEQTMVASIAIFQHVEQLQFAAANRLSIALMLLAVGSLLLAHLLQGLAQKSKAPFHLRGEHA